MLDSYPRAWIYADGAYAGVVLRVADVPHRRIRGLLGQKEVPASEGLIITPTTSIHCIGMSVPIDVVYLDALCRRTKPAEASVLMAETCLPGTIGANPKGTRSVIELAAGQAARFGLEAGTHIWIVPYGAASVAPLPLS